MTEDLHERATRMISAEKVEGLTAEESEWLESHLSACPACAKRAEALGQAISSLRSISVQVDPALLPATRRLVRGRAEAIEERRNRRRLIWMATALSVLWMAVTAAVMWQGLEWLGRSLSWADGMRTSALLLAWFLPATALALALALMRGANVNRVEN